MSPTRWSSGRPPASTRTTRTRALPSRGPTGAGDRDGGGAWSREVGTNGPDPV